MFHREFFLLGRRLAVTGSAWLKTQSVIFLMTSSLSMLGLLLIGNPYYILGGIGIGVLDALPIFGTGTALVPWSILLLFKREWGHALILFGLYLLCYFLREFTEAHLMGKKMGLSPLETLAAKSTGTVVGCCAALAEGDAAKRTDIKLVFGGAGAKGMIKTLMDGKDPRIVANVSYSPKFMYDSIKLTAEARLKGEKLPATYIIPSVLITKENAADFYFPDSPF